MIVGRHGILHTEVVILYAVISDIYYYEKILAAYGRFDIALSVAGRKSRAFALNEEGIHVDAAFSCPVNEVIVDLLSQLGHAVHSYDADRCDVGIAAE